MCHYTQQAQLAALAQAEVALRQAQPRNPRSAYELFASEIAKYACFSACVQN